MRRGRRKAEPAVVDETPEAEAGAEAKAPAPSPAPDPEPEPPDPAAELDARFDAARARLRAKIAPPDPED